MGNQLSNALKALGEGISTIAMYRLNKEEKEGERAYQKEMRDGQNAFQERLLELNQAHSDKTLAQDREFRSLEREDKQLFDLDMFNRQAAIQEKQFAQEMAARWAQIRASAASSSGSSDAAAERALTRQLGVYEKQIELAASEYSGLQESLNEELKELGKDKMLAMRPEQLQAAKLEIMERYKPRMSEAKAKISEGMGTYSRAVGIDSGADFSGSRAEVKRFANGKPEEPMKAGGMSGGMAATGQALNDEKVTQAVEAAKRQLGSAATMPSEANLVAGFERAGLSRAEAVKAARQLQRGR